MASLMDALFGGSKKKPAKKKIMMKNAQRGAGGFGGKRRSRNIDAIVSRAARGK